MVDFYYRKHGKGIKNIICFHGFGEDHKVFDSMIAQILQAEINVTCYAIDIYYHGESNRENEPLSKLQWKQAFHRFLDQEKIKKFSLIGFSLGGRFSLATMMAFPKAIESVFLIAPDGVFQSVWYKIATSFPGNSLFKYFMNTPKTFDRFVTLSKKTGLVSRSLTRFVETSLRETHQRQRVYQTWTYFSPLQPKLSSVTRCINQHNIPTHVVLGIHDNIIPPKKILTKLKPIRHLQTEVVNAKHHQMIKESTPYIISALKNQNL